MRRFSTFAASVTLALLLAGASASAQIMVAPGAPLLPPPPPPPPPPKIEVPAIPRLDAAPALPRARTTVRPSFGDRVTRCLDEGAAAGLDPADRATYSRACANRD